MLSLLKNRLARAKTHRPVRLSLEALEERWCPATAYWIGHNVSDLSWNSAANWSDDAVPQNGDTVVFSMNRSYYSPDIDANTASVNLVLQGYRSEMFIEPGTTMNLLTVTDDDPSVDSFSVQFQPGSQEGTLNIDGWATLYNTNIQAVSGATGIIGLTQGGLTLGDGKGYAVGIGVPISSFQSTIKIGDVSGNGASSVGFFSDSSSPFAAINLYDESNLIFYGASPAANLAASGVVSNGTFISLGNGYVSVDKQAVDGSYGSTVKLVNNHANPMGANSLGLGFDVYGDETTTFIVNQGSWDVNGTAPDIDANSKVVDANLNSIFVDGGSLFQLGLAGQATLSVGTGIEFIANAGGSAPTVGVYTTKSALDTDNIATGTANFLDGDLYIGADIEFDVGIDCQFGGGQKGLTLNMLIDPTADTSSKIKTNNASIYLNFAGNTTLDVGVNGGGNVQVNPPLTWTLMDATAYNGHGIRGSFAVKYPPNVSTVAGSQGNNLWQCQS